MDGEWETKKEGGEGIKGQCIHSTIQMVKDCLHKYAGMVCVVYVYMMNTRKGIHVHQRQTVKNTELPYMGF